MIRAPAALVLACALLGCKSDREAVPAETTAPAAPVAPTDEAPAPASPTDPAPHALPPRAVPQPVVLPEPPALVAEPLGLPAAPSPDHNPITPAKVQLGRLLFFDPRLSVGDRMSCASCHDPAKGWADGRELSLTAGAALNQRHTPTLFNVGYHDELYWDGRVPILEAMILSNWRGQLGADPDAVAERLARMPVYQAHFQRAFRSEPTRDRIAEALAAFVRTLRSGGSPWDRYEAGEAGAVSDDTIAGARVFNDRAGCALCHPPPLYTDLGYHDIGLARSELAPDPGRMLATGDPRDRGAFKTPTLRGLVHTAPYFHNGSAPTLEAALDHELSRAGAALSARERAQLLAFLRALSDPSPPSSPPPALPKEPPPGAEDGGIVAP